MLVVGAGPAGMSAAIAAAEAGAEVVVLDERSATGGQYAKPLADSHADAAPDAQFRLGTRLRERALAAGVRIETEATVWGAFAADEIAAMVGGRAVTFRPRRLVLATGAHERPVPMPGWTLPGVMTTGSLQTLVRAQRVCPGERVLIAGSGPLNLQLACELLAGGVKPLAVVEAAPRPGLASWRDAWTMTRAAPDLVREGIGMLVTLKRAGVPVLWSARVTGCTARRACAAASVARSDVRVDVVALNLGFQPETGLARALGAAHRFVDVGLGHLATETEDDGRTSVGGVFAVGDGASLGGSRVAMARGRLAGLAAARELGLHAPDEPATRAALARALAFQDALWRVFRPPRSPAALADATIVCRCEEVTAGRLRQELAGGLTSLPALKKATRAGMGRCQGRFCSATIARLCPDAPDDFAFAAPRAPLRPVPAAPLMFERPSSRRRCCERRTRRRICIRCPTLPAETRHADVLVIGGGLAGLCTAYFLAKDGADVLLVERDEAGMAASTANAGSLHVQLLSYDFDDDTPEDGGPAAHTLPLAPRSIALWKQIAAEAGEDLGIRTEGGLMLADRRRRTWTGCGASRRWSGAGGSKATCSAPTNCATWRPPGRNDGGRRFRSGRGLWRPAARHAGGAEAGAAPRRARAARRRGAGDRARWRRVARDDEQGRDHCRARGECDGALGGAYRPDGGFGSAGDRHGAAGHRHRAGAAADAASGRAGATGICR